MGGRLQCLSQRLWPGRRELHGYAQVNEEPVYPQALPISATLPETITYAGLPGAALRYGTDVHEFTYFWADHDLDTPAASLYTSPPTDRSARMATQRETGDTCVRPPDYLPPPQPVIQEATPLYDGCHPRASGTLS